MNNRSKLYKQIMIEIDNKIKSQGKRLMIRQRYRLINKAYKKHIKMLVKKQLTPLYKQIMCENMTGLNKFKVFSMEAGLGKTTTIVNALVDLYNKDSNIFTLVVTKFIDDGIKIAKQINDKVGKDIAFSYNSKTKKLANCTNIKNYNVVIITHAKYLQLSDSNFRYRLDLHMLLASKRTNLIIDEELNNIIIESLSRRDLLNIEQILEGLNNNISDMFRNIVKPIEQKITTNNINEPQLIQIKKNDTEIEIANLIDTIHKCNISKNYFRSIETKYGILETNDSLIKKIENINLFYNRDIVIYKDKIYADNSITNLLSLENNIILDASANINSMYNLSSKYEVLSFDRIIDHSNWNIHWCNINTSQSAKARYNSFYPEVIKFINKKTKHNDNGLVLTNKNECNFIKKYYNLNNNLDITNFQAMRGKNKWRFFNKCFIIDTPAKPNVYYIISYMLLTGKNLAPYQMIYKKSEGHLKFVNNLKLQQYLEDDITCSIYQGIKRVNRDNKYNTDVYILCNYDDVIDTVVAQLPNATLKQFDIQANKNKQRKKYTRISQRLTYAEKFISLLYKYMLKIKLANAKPLLKKKYVYEKLGCSKGNFRTNVLDRKEVKDYMKKNGITEKGQCIYFNRI